MFEGIVILIILGFVVHVFQQKKKEKGKQILKPIHLVTQLSQQKLKDVLKDKLPDEHYNTPGWLPSSMDKNHGLIYEISSEQENPGKLSFGIMGYGGMLGTIHVTLLDGTKKDCIITFNVTITPSKNHQGKHIVSFIPTKWTTKNGIFEQTQKLIRAKDKFTGIILAEDPHAADISPSS